MTTVLALDLAKNSGYAVIDEDGRVRACGSWNLAWGLAESGKSALPLDTRHVIQIQRLRKAVASVCRDFGVDVVGVEREFGRGVGSRLLVSLYTAANEAAYDAGAAALGIRLGDWRKGIHGTSGKSTDFYKSEALRICAADGIEVPDADAAEAVLIARFVQRNARVTPSAPARGFAA
ncbi:hypothetical protein H9Q09_11875 [Aurantimonas sp. DM33-3]|uniref:hypothetical protein n=1 Tax=Aurantimonas sp. DM33-3 TaxID=2766955 RepID=UPI0016527E8A|nr:hypothetical protein [Aurantimonas sp. DM33-3]MBC6716906.1 hypothetical protein [Aurantimonas sp. DM33-3]